MPRNIQLGFINSKCLPLPSFLPSPAWHLQVTSLSAELALRCCSLPQEASAVLQTRSARSIEVWMAMSSFPPLGFDRSSSPLPTLPWWLLKLVVNWRGHPDMSFLPGSYLTGTVRSISKSVLPAPSNSRAEREEGVESNYSLSSAWSIIPSNIFFPCYPVVLLIKYWGRLPTVFSWSLFHSHMDLRQFFLELSLKISGVFSRCHYITLFNTHWSSSMISKCMLMYLTKVLGYLDVMLIVEQGGAEAEAFNTPGYVLPSIYSAVGII